MGSRSPLRGRDNFEGGERPIVKCRDTYNAESIEMPFGPQARMVRRNPVLDGGLAVLRDVAMATNFWDAICCNWLCGL